MLIPLDWKLFPTETKLSLSQSSAMITWLAENMKLVFLLKCCSCSLQLEYGSYYIRIKAHISNQYLRFEYPSLFNIIETKFQVLHAHLKDAITLWNELCTRFLKRQSQRLLLTFPVTLSPKLLLKDVDFIYFIPYELSRRQMV